MDWKESKMTTLDEIRRRGIKKRNKFTSSTIRVELLKKKQNRKSHFVQKHFQFLSNISI